MHKYLFLLIGFVSTGLAIVGVYVPGMPTTIFVIVALWAFSRASNRVYYWFRRIPLLRNALVHADAYLEHRAVTKRVKLLSQVFAWSSVAFVLFLHASWLVVGGVLIAATACSVFMRYTRTLEKL